MTTKANKDNFIHILLFIKNKKILKSLFPVVFFKKGLISRHIKYIKITTKQHRDIVDGCRERIRSKVNRVLISQEFNKIIKLPYTEENISIFTNTITKMSDYLKYCVYEDNHYGKTMRGAVHFKLNKAYLSNIVV